MHQKNPQSPIYPFTLSPLLLMHPKFLPMTHAQEAGKKPQHNNKKTQQVDEQTSNHTGETMYFLHRSTKALGHCSIVKLFPLPSRKVREETSTSKKRNENCTNRCNSSFFILGNYSCLLTLKAVILAIRYFTNN